MCALKLPQSWLWFLARREPSSTLNITIPMKPTRPVYLVCTLLGFSLLTHETRGQSASLASPDPSAAEAAVLAAASNAVQGARIILLPNLLLQNAQSALASPSGMTASTGSVETVIVPVQGVSTNGQSALTFVYHTSPPPPPATASVAGTASAVGQRSDSPQPLDSMGPSCVRAGSGLIGWWQAENSADNSAGSHPGQPIGDTGYAAGMVGEAFSFDGYDDSVRISPPDGLATQSFSVEAWINPSRMPYGQAFVFGQCYGRQLVVFPLGSSLHAALYVSDPQGVFHGGVSSAVIPTGQWTHVAGTWDGVSLTLYINGVRDYWGQFDLPEIADSGCPWSIGGIYNACGYFGQCFPGLVDEVSLYDRPLLAGEINAIYLAGSAGKCKGPPACVSAPASAVAWWAAEGDASDAFRLSGGTPQNNPAYASGMAGQAFSLNGDNQAVEIPYTSRLVSPAFSVEAWIKPEDQVGNWLGQAFIFGQNYGRQLAVRVGSRGLGAAFVVSTSRLAFYEVDSSGEIPLHEWTHLVGTWDGVSSLSLYVNGALDQQATINVTPWDSGCGFYIGGINGPPGDCVYSGQFFNGLIDEATLYNTALSPAEVQAIYNTGTAGKCNIPGAWLEQYFGTGFRTNPNAALNADPDEDGLTNLEEYQQGANPTNTDTNGDGLSDGDEVHIYLTAPTRADTDADGLTDYEELHIPVDINHPELGHLDPLVRDTGGTGVPDGEKDSDHDGLSNLGELRKYGSNPAKACSFPPYAKDDATYLFTGPVTYGPATTSTYLGLPQFLAGNLIRLTLHNARPNAIWDLYYKPSLSLPKIRLLCPGIPGQTVFVFPDPQPRRWGGLDRAGGRGR